MHIFWRRIPIKALGKTMSAGFCLDEIYLQTYPVDFVWISDTRFATKQFKVDEYSLMQCNTI